MKKAFLLSLLTLLAAVSSFADDERHQSYLSYDDGGTIVKSGEDGREIEAHRNLPIYPGDEIVTARRGRAEVRLSDGNIIGIDRTTALRVTSVLDAYEADANETVVELRYGKIAVHRTDIGRDHVRLDTGSASYVAERLSVYSVETDSNGRDRVTVFAGAIEVRTPSRTTRLRSGESATVDDRGVYDLAGDQRDSADDFERWFLKRADRFDNYQNRYVDRRLGYWADDLDDHGRWVHVTGIGWGWRPYVSAGWRPYYNGYWHHGRGGSLVWVSYDPWGWGTHHYGRWAFDPGFGGWFWVPGYGYSPAWVYWSYGSGYIGWAPAGYWDCYRPYYNWAYHPYRNYGARNFGFGFNGRVRVGEFDLRPWTFVDSNTLISNRIDRAALTTDAVKNRLGRSKDGFVPITGGPARFTREEVRDPAEAIRRRGIDGRMTGRETGAPPADMTPFVRRDTDLGTTIRDRVVRSRGAAPTPVAGAPATLPRSGGGSAATPATGGVDRRRAGGGEGRIGREPGTTPRATPATPAPATGETAAPSWRGRIGERRADRPERQVTPGDSTTTTPRPSGRNDSWRNRVRTEGSSDTTSDRRSSGSSDRSSAGGSSSDVPRRVIDRIGGARVVPREGSTSGGSSTGSSSGSSRESGSRDRGTVRDSGGSRRDSGGSSSGGSSTRQSPPPSNSGSSGSAGGRRESGGSNSSGRSNDSGGGGRVKRDQ
ncbi:MAG TPA: FecR family protein [Thermoanaerobaculia bacterium]|nr:FecR family protein [Thermoanaerobaculia bacterium]